METLFAIIPYFACFGAGRIPRNHFLLCSAAAAARTPRFSVCVFRGSQEKENNHLALIATYSAGRAYYFNKALNGINAHNRFYWVPSWNTAKRREGNVGLAEAEGEEGRSGGGGGSAQVTFLVVLSQVTSLVPAKASLCASRRDSSNHQKSNRSQPQGRSQRGQKSDTPD